MLTSNYIIKDNIYGAEKLTIITKIYNLYKIWMSIFCVACS